MSPIDKKIERFLLPYVVNAAIRGGAAVMDVYNSSVDYDVTIKEDKTPMIDADRAAHTAIKEALGPTRIPILSEEGREMLYEERCNWEMFWLVDPLDGTIEFINRNDEFTVNIALMSEGRAVASVVYAPSLEKLYVAVEGSGAFLRRDVKPNAESDMSYEELSEMMVSLPLITEPREVQRVAVSRSHITPETHTQIDVVRKQFPDLVLVEQGSSYKFCLLAEGDVDYYVRTSFTYEWDTAAGELVLSEAGGRTTSLEGGDLKYNKEDLHNPWFKSYSAISKIV